MKVYRVNHHGILVSAEVPDGAICMEIGSTHDGTPDKGTKLPMIAFINFREKTYRRQGWRKPRPWPEKCYRIDDVEWTNVTDPQLVPPFGCRLTEPTEP